MSEVYDFKRAIHDYVDLQTKLLRAYEEAHPGGLSSLVERGAGGSGGPSIIEVDWEECWLVRRHGMGIAFRNWEGTTVDAHRHPQTYDGIDQWRISQWLDFMYTPGDFLDPTTDEFFANVDVDSELKKLCDQGEIIETDDRRFYRLKS